MYRKKIAQISSHISVVLAMCDHKITLFIKYTMNKNNLEFISTNTIPDKRIDRKQ